MSAGANRGRGKDRRVAAIGACALIVAVLGGCAQQPRSLYGWGSYQDQVYTYLKGEDSDYARQIEALQRDAEKAKAANLPLPPGYHAQLALLYDKLGQTDNAHSELLAEQAAYPEATSFVTFIQSHSASK